MGAVTWRPRATVAHGRVVTGGWACAPAMVEVVAAPSTKTTPATIMASAAARRSATL